MTELATAKAITLRGGRPTKHDANLKRHVSSCTEMNMKSQKQLIKAALESGQAVTRRGAYVDMGILNPTARIAELRQDGLPIKTTIKTVRNRHGKTARVAVWSLVVRG